MVYARSSIRSISIAFSRYSNRPLTDLKIYTFPKIRGRILLITSRLQVNLKWKHCSITFKGSLRALGSASYRYRIHPKNTWVSISFMPTWIHFVRIVGADMFLEVQTGRGRMDLLIIHNQRKYIVETKVWEGVRYYQSGQKGNSPHTLNRKRRWRGYYVVFDHRKNPESQRETEKVGDVEIRSYVIPVLQKPSISGLDTVLRNQSSNTKLSRCMISS